MATDNRLWYIDCDFRGYLMNKSIGNLAPFKAGYNKNRYHNGRKPTIYLTIDTNWLMNYFLVSRRCIKRWIKENKFLPTDINSIVEYKQLLTK